MEKLRNSAKYILPTLAFITIAPGVVKWVLDLLH